MRAITAKKIMEILLTNGFALSRTKGSHAIYRHEESGIIVPVPFHGKNKPLPIGTMLSIIKQSKIPIEKFKN